MATLYRSYEAIPVRASVRFPLRLEIVLRTADREYPGITEDVSANGLLFAADELPPVGTEIQFELTMPAAVMGGVNDVLLHCLGRIVRHQRVADKELAAAVIDEYSFRG
ncbi:MAG: PilZ domain-containing protein [Acidobacteriaceae bacterium]